MSTRRTAVFAKRPEPGEVKTRLCPPLAPEEAAELALAMLDDTVGAVRRGAVEGGYEVCLAAAPAEDLAWFRERYPGLAVVPQAGAGLGPRLAAWFEAALAPGAAATAVVVGADAPHLGAERVARAHAALEAGADLVLAPDDGGGYHLVGLARPVPELFTRIEMSTPDMCARTVTLARSLGLAVELLDTGFDVDTPADLERLARLVRDAAPPRLLRDLERTAPLVARLVPDPQPR